MIRQNLHTHTVFDDGSGTPMEMALAAVSAGLTGLGFSGHSVLPYGNDWAMTERSREEWLADVSRTKRAMEGRLEIFLGLEWDLLSEAPEGYEIVWSDGQKGSTCTITATKSEYSVSASLVKDGKTVKTTQEEVVTVNTGFFARLSVFIRKLLGINPPVYIDNIKH